MEVLVVWYDHVENVILLIESNTEYEQEHKNGSTRIFITEEYSAIFSERNLSNGVRQIYL